MAHNVDVRLATAPPQGGGAQELLGWMATSNPFYVVSAGFFLAGLWISFGGKTQSEETWALISGLAGYTLLLAATAFVLVRFCKLWDDARTVLLLVVLMFLAMSVTFDELLVMERSRGIVCNVGGLLFAIGVTEALLRGIRLRLPVLYRGPYYLLLALFFLYPLALSPAVDGPRSEELLWGLFGFAPCAGLIFLTLLPAVRRGPNYVRANGSPWSWPVYPWALFGVFAVAVAGRAWLLCVSMDLLNLGHGGRVIFGPYFLVPLGLAGIILLLEIGIVSQNPRVLQAALMAPGVLIFLCLVGQQSNLIYRGFVAMFTARLGGDPLFATLLPLAVYYLYAMVRRVPWAAEGLTTVLALLAIVGSEALDRGLPHTPGAEPLLAIALLQLALGLRQRSAWRCALGGVALVAGWMLAFGDATPRAWIIALHLILLAILMVAALFDDAFARTLRLAGAGVALLACLAGLFLPADDFLGFPGWAVEAYPPTMAITLGAYALLLNCRPALAMGGLALGGWLAAVGLRGYTSVRQFVTGLDYLVIGLTLFVLALLISLAKSGILARWVAMHGRKAPDSSD